MDFIPLLPTDAPRRISPTDISQFVRLDQCARYLRLRLYERTTDRSFMTRYGVAPQAIPPLLTRTGAEFEQRIEAQVSAPGAAARTAINCKTAAAHDPRFATDVQNAVLLELVRALPAGEVLFLFQPRLQVLVDGWQIRGDIDVLRIERTAAGALQVLIADMKSSKRARVEHRLQVAIYRKMLARLLEKNGLHAAIETAVLYRGPAEDVQPETQQEQELHEQQREAAWALFRVEDALLEIVADADNYGHEVEHLLTGKDSLALQIAQQPFAGLPFHLNRKCDGCLYQEFCLKWAYEHDDLSLLPYLADHEKNSLHSAGITTVAQLAQLKDLPAGTKELVTPPAHVELVQRVVALPRIGRRLNELIHRARRFRGKRDGLTSLPHIPDRGYGTLPVCDAEHHANLVTIFIDAQHDYLNDRLYLLGALVTAADGGVVTDERRRTVLRLSDGPPNDAAAEQALLVGWIGGILRAVAELAAPDAEGNLNAPLHLVFATAATQARLLDGLARHFGAITMATPLYDLITQIAALDSPLVSYLDEEIRTLRNYPLTAQALPAVARYLGFDWDATLPLRSIFRTRLFDDQGVLDDDGGEREYYTRRARFSGDIPLEYAYAAWDALPPAGRNDAYALYRQSTPQLLSALLERRLEAIASIAAGFAGAREVYKTPFDLSRLPTFEGKARHFADALDEFLTLERIAELGEWKQQRLPAPEQRVLNGTTLLLRYRAELDSDFAGRALITAENERRRRLRAEYEAAFRLANPTATKVQLSKAQLAETRILQPPDTVTFAIETNGLDCNLATALALSTLRRGDGLVFAPRSLVDERLPAEQRVAYTPTVKQLLYARRAKLVELNAAAGTVTLKFEKSFGGKHAGYVFGNSEAADRLFDGALYTIDPDPNDWYGHHLKETIVGLQGGVPNTVARRLDEPRQLRLPQPAAAIAAQERFVAGLEALHAAEPLHPGDPATPFDKHQRPYLAGHADVPTLLVQGPPGTGKSYTTAFALLARLQAAIAARRTFRVFVSCKTHAATDVLLQNVFNVWQLLRERVVRQPQIAAHYFEPQLLELLGATMAPIFRVAGKRAADGTGNGAAGSGVPAQPIEVELPPQIIQLDGDVAANIVPERPYCVVGATPGGVRKMLKATGSLFGHDFCDCLVLDEASQMNLPEAIMAGLALHEDGMLIVVGDHRQMPPIVKHGWERERRRTFQQYQTHLSLFETLMEQVPAPPMVRFAESFRLHTRLAEFLCEQIYRQDGIEYFSRKTALIDRHTHDDTFVAAVLDPDYPLVVVVHDEAASQTSNPYEQQLVGAVLTALLDEQKHALSAEHGLGVVVPHRAQRAELLDSVEGLTVFDDNNQPKLTAVDTVERFQGGEREVILVSATESDRDYLRSAGEFLLNPRRLNVALSRAKKKLILVASRSVFTLFSDDEELFENLQIWKNLLRTCDTSLWQGERHGHDVTVWGRG
jgi:hypothetical protein